MNKDVEDMMEVCKWVDCDCEVPSWALSAHNRVNFCKKFKMRRALEQLRKDDGEFL